MKMTKISIMIAIVATLLLSMASMQVGINKASFRDTVTSTDNTFQAGVWEQTENTVN